MRETDALHRFVFEQLPLRGEIVHLDSIWQAVCARRQYPAPIRQLLGEALAATALLYATVKFDGLLSLQIQSEGPLDLLLIHCTAVGSLRATAHWKGEIADTASLAELCPAGVLAITIDPGAGRERYQGLVELDSVSLSMALERYFERSEQLPTRFVLSADTRVAAGMLLQRVPGDSPDADAWNRVQQLGITLQEEELRTLEAATLLRRLFHEEDLRLFEPQRLSFRCNCSRERSSRLLQGMQRIELEELLREQGYVEVICEFCGLQYRFDAVDVAALFTDTIAGSATSTRH